MFVTDYWGHGPFKPCGVKTPIQNFQRQPRQQDTISTVFQNVSPAYWSPGVLDAKGGMGWGVWGMGKGNGVRRNGIGDGDGVVDAVGHGGVDRGEGP